jgi:hypothetical protein
VKRIVEFIFIVFAFAVLSNNIFAQATVNPDISFIGDMRLFGYNNAPSDEFDNKLKLQFEELEISANGYLNPYTRADLALGIEGTGGEIDVEEAYATVLRGLPLNLQIKAGQYLVDIGKINTQHGHVWSWINRPLMGQQFLGEEGLKDVGLNINMMIPIGRSAFTLSGNLLQGDFWAPEEAEEVNYNMGGSARAALFSPIGTYSSLEIGGSWLTGQCDPANDRSANLGAFDFKYKWRPDVYRSLTITGEALFNSRKVAILDEVSGDTLDGEKSVNSMGFFGAVDYQFKRRFNIGGLIDYSQTPENGDIYQIGYGAFFGFSLAEETFRTNLLIRQDDGKDWDKPYQSIYLQLLWSLGPHKPHQF